jgi:hypothetical protein
VQLAPVALQVGPPSGGGGGGGAVTTHVPASWPTTTAHAFPAQQSLVDVQEPPVLTHIGVAQRSTPPASGKHGAPPQHSEENVH